jgi:hypothetical protein
LDSKAEKNKKVGDQLGSISDKISHKEIHSTLGVDADAVYDQFDGEDGQIGSFGRVFSGDTANAWKQTPGMLPGKDQRHFDHPDYDEGPK